MNPKSITRKLASLFLVLTFALVLSVGASAAPNQPAAPKPESKSQPQDTQYFQDIPVGSFFYSFTATLFQQGVVSGFACGTAPAGACVPPDNLPYYVPSGNVTRGQMSIFINNARTKPGINITGNASKSISLFNDLPGADVLYIRATGSANYGINVNSQDSYGIYARSNTTNGIYATSTYTGVAALYGYNGSHDGIGLYGYADGDTGVGVSGSGTSNGVRGFSAAGYGVDGSSTSSYGVHATSTSSYGGYFLSTGNDAADFHGADWGIYVVNTGTQPGGSFYGQGTGMGVFAQSAGNTVADAARFDDGGPGGSKYAMYANGDGRVTGTFYNPLSVGGGNAAIMKNVSGQQLERGDVVVIAGDSSEMVMDGVPAINVKLADKANDATVIGIVDAPVFVPDAATAAAYAQQLKDEQAALAAAGTDPAKKAAAVNSTKHIAEDAGRIHSMDGTTINAGGYAKVVTLGAYQTIKVDASFGAIKAGDLLTSSPHAGYAMKADSKLSDGKGSNGTIIGKALGSLNSGEGTIAVMVTLK